MKQLLVTMFRDLGILAVVIVIVLIFSFFVPVPWKIAVSFLITAYAVIEITRIMLRTDISYYTRRWPIITLFLADFICAHFLLKGGFEKFQWMKIIGILAVSWVANLQLKMQKAEQEETGTETGEKTETEKETAV